MQWRPRPVYSAEEEEGILDTIGETDGHAASAMTFEDPVEEWTSEGRTKGNTDLAPTVGELGLNDEDVTPHPGTSENTDIAFGAGETRRIHILLKITLAAIRLILLLSTL